MEVDYDPTCKAGAAIEALALQKLLNVLEWPSQSLDRKQFNSVWAISELVETEKPNLR